MIQKTEPIRQAILLPITDLHAPDYYCRIDTGKMNFIEKSLEKYGQLLPILVNTFKDRENVIIDGVVRWEICRALGYKTIKAFITNVPKEDEVQQHIISNEQARRFYREFIEEFITEDLADALLRYYSLDEETQKEDPLKDIQSTSDLGEELTKFNIAVYRREADWFDAMKTTHGHKNR